jgi:anti-sigma regulatory factor (Ser/Thr protein kinase)
LDDRALSRKRKRSNWAGTDLELRLESGLESLSDCQADLEQYFSLHGLDRRAVNRIEVIFEELASNAMRHGFTPGSDQSVRVWLRALPDVIELTFEDDGRPFNPLEKAPPPAFETIETASVGGLGIPLVRKLSTAFHYERPTPPAGGQAGGDGFQPVNRTIVAVAR